MGCRDSQKQTPCAKRMEDILLRCRANESIAFEIGVTYTVFCSVCKSKFKNNQNVNVFEIANLCKIVQNKCYFCVCVRWISLFIFIFISFCFGINSSYTQHTDDVIALWIWVEATEKNKSSNYLFRINSFLSFSLISSLFFNQIIEQFIDKFEWVSMKFLSRLANYSLSTN